MDVKYYKEILKNLDLKFTNKKIKNFLPKISKSYSKDKKKFSEFWKTCNSELKTLVTNKKQKSL